MKVVHDWTLIEKRPQMVLRMRSITLMFMIKRTSKLQRRCYMTTSVTAVVVTLWCYPCNPSIPFLKVVHTRYISPCFLSPVAVSCGSCVNSNVICGGSHEFRNWCRIVQVVVLRPRHVTEYIFKQEFCVYPETSCTSEVIYWASRHFKTFLSGILTKRKCVLWNQQL